VEDLSVARTHPAPPHRTVVARALVSAALLALIWGGPFCRQVLHRGRDEILHPWRMYSGAGLAATEVEYRTRNAAGREIVLDRYALLANGSAASEEVRVVEDAEAAKRVGRALCQALGPGRSVYAHLRVGTSEGWKVVLAGEDDLCAK
jgi:hypothetical protein